jgi:UDP-N-acetylglucosamine--N-acetylmuramyl-(pentapeptide) pyrophosphoryl-undecaprenol N-acetylglucosamine transferase
MLLIPLKNSASRGDQVENAKLFKELGYAHVLYQTELSPLKLLDEIKLLTKNETKLITQMQTAKKTEGCKNIYEQILKYTKK